jgi:hypothetical protein
LRRQEDRDALLPAQARDLFPHGGPALRVEPGRRLVEEEDPREVDEREREIQAPLHATRVARHLAVGGVGEADALEELVRVHLAAVLADALQRRLQSKVVATGEQRVERRLLERDADHRAHLRAFLDDVVATDTCSSGRWRQQRRQDVDGGRLPGPVRAEEAVDLTRSDGDVDAVDGARALLVLPNEPFDLDPVGRRLHHPTLPGVARASEPSRPLRHEASGG